MSATSNLPEGKPLEVLREIGKQAGEVKSAQRRGSRSVRNARIFSGQPYDLQTPDQGGTVQSYEIEFIPDDTRFGGALCYQLVVVDVTYPSDPLLVRDVERIWQGADRRQRWRMYVQSFGLSQRFKFYFFAQGPGTFMVNKLS